MAEPLIEESIDIDATPDRVWSVVSDLKRMGEWSPQCMKMIVRGGPLHVGTRTVNVNRRGPLVWPTTSKVIRLEPAKELAFRVIENRTVWSYTIEPNAEGTGVRVTERREVPTATTAVSAFFIDKLMGGEKSFEAELKVGMAKTLGKIKRTAEN